MIYLKLSRNQDQEWSPVTISSLAKMLVGVNNIVVENLDFSANDNEIVISARPNKRNQCFRVFLYPRHPYPGRRQSGKGRRELRI